MHGSTFSLSSTKHVSIHNQDLKEMLRSVWTSAIYPLQSNHTNTNIRNSKQNFQRTLLDILDAIYYVVNANI